MTATATADSDLVPPNQSDEQQQATDGPPPHRVLRRVLATLIAVLALLVASLSGAWFAARNHPGDDSPEAGFARDMSTHHGQAVGMAALAYRTTTDSTVQQLALDISLTQQGQIGMMQTWLDAWRLSPGSTAPPMAWMGKDKQGMAAHDSGQGSHEGNLMPGMATAAQLTEFRAARGQAQDILFCKLMIRHHRAAIPMTDAILAETGNRQVRDLAQSIKNGQTAEIRALEALQRRLEATAPK